MSFEHLQKEIQRIESKYQPRLSVIRVKPKFGKQPINVACAPEVKSTLKLAGVAAFGLSRARKCDYMPPPEEFQVSDPLGQASPDSAA